MSKHLHPSTLNFPYLVQVWLTYYLSWGYFRVCTSSAKFHLCDLMPPKQIYGVFPNILSITWNSFCFRKKCATGDRVSEPKDFSHFGFILSAAFLQSCEFEMWAHSCSWLPCPLLAASLPHCDGGRVLSLWNAKLQINPSISCLGHTVKSQSNSSNLFRSSRYLLPIIGQVAKMFPILNCMIQGSLLHRPCSSRTQTCLLFHLDPWQNFTDVPRPWIKGRLSA